MKISKAQLSALKRVEMWQQGGTYMPFATEARTFEVCEKYGWLIYRSVDDGFSYNGYQLTDKGKEILAAKHLTH